MIPHALPALALALAAFRTWWLLARDDLPPLVKARNWAVGATFTAQGVDFKRPLLADWLACAWCSGLWISAAWYVAWLEERRYALYGTVPLALSAILACLVSVIPDE